MSIALDIGTSHVRLLAPAGDLLSVPAVVAVDDATRHLVAVGERALQMDGRTGGRVAIRFPVREGPAAEPSWIEAIVADLLRRSLGWRRWLHPEVRVCVPATLKSIDREALLDITSAAAGAAARPISAPLAAARGAGVTDGRACLLVDIGAAQTEAALLYRGDVLAAAATQVAGLAFDRALQRVCRDTLGLGVTESQAEAIKLQAGTVVWPGGDDVPAETRVNGRDVITGKRREDTLRGADVARALQPLVSQIGALLCEVASRTPPPLASDLLEEGVVLVGGGAQSPGLAFCLEQQVGLPVRLAASAATCVIRGSALVNDRPGVDSPPLMEVR